MKDILQKEKMDDIIDIVYAPLDKCKIALDNNTWYDLKILDNAVANKKVDMAISDGPPAWQKSKERSRYPAVPFIDKLKDDFAIDLDDAFREGEQAILKLWETEFATKFSFAGDKFSHYHAGNTFFIETM